MGFKLEDWWSYKTLFDLNPVATWKFAPVYATLTIVCLVIALIIAIPAVPLNPSLKRRWRNLLWTNGLIGLLLYACRIQEIPILSMDALRTLQEIILVIWINAIVWYTRTRYRQEKITVKAVERYNKYLPKPKA